MKVLREIQKRYQIEFDRIGIDRDHMYILCGAVPRYSPSKTVAIIKSIGARKIFKKFPKIKKDLCGGEFLTDLYYVSTIGEGANKEIIEKYIERQGKTSEEVQLKIFEM